MDVPSNSPYGVNPRIRQQMQQNIMYHQQQPQRTMPHLAGSHTGLGLNLGQIPSSQENMSPVLMYNPQVCQKKQLFDHKFN